jgi:hypothetical protein
VVRRHEADYVPIVDPDEGNLVAILGYLDVVHLLDQAAKQVRFRALFASPICLYLGLHLSLSSPYLCRQAGAPSPTTHPNAPLPIEPLSEPLYSQISPSALVDPPPTHPT